MKRHHLIWLAATLLAGVVTQTHAQFRPAHQDGLAASPRARETLEERARGLRAHGTIAPDTRTRATRFDHLAASPRVRAMIEERQAGQATSGVSRPEVTSKSAGYRVTGDDGLAASPRVRQMLDERSRSVVEIAPLK